MMIAPGTSVPACTLARKALLPLLLLSTAAAAVVVDTGATKGLSLAFPGMQQVHIDVLASDGVPGTADGARVARSYWKSDAALIEVPAGVYDVTLRRGAATLLFDDVDCTLAATCVVDAAPAELRVDFPGLSGVHTRVLVADGPKAGETHLDANWQNDQVQVPVFPGVYDLLLRDGPAELLIEDVDCTGATCAIDLDPPTLTLRFDSLSPVHAAVYAPDGTRVAKAGWQHDQIRFSLLPGRYDATLDYNGQTYRFDDLDCSQDCMADLEPVVLTVPFTRLTNVHTEVLLADGLAGQASGARIAKQDWQNDAARLSVPRGRYDLRVRDGEAERIIDNLDCTDGPCSPGELASELQVLFAGMGSVHVGVYTEDGVADAATGTKITRKGWLTDGLTLPLLGGTYDVTVGRDQATLVFDAVDCTGAGCTVDLTPVQLDVAFPGLSQVHTDILLADGRANSADGARMHNSHWKTDRTALAVLPARFDLRLKKGAAVHVIDAIDCTDGDCAAALEPTRLQIAFPGLSQVHTDVLLDDGAIGSADGERHQKADWQTDATEIPVFPGTYDLKIRNGAASHIVDAVDCTGSRCTADFAPSLLSVEFPGLRNVHTEVRVADAVPGAGGGRVKSSNWKTDGTEIALLPGAYDLIIRHGAATLIMEDIDCTGPTCTAAAPMAQLTVAFPGLRSVHTKVRLPDDVPGAAGGEHVTSANWQSNATEVPILRGVYDVLVDHAVDQVFDAVDCSAGPCAVEVSGDAQVTLADGDSGAPIPGQRVDAYEKADDGSLTRRAHGTTDPAGRIHFTLPGLDDGATYVLKTYNPFGNGKRYYSPLLMATGPFRFEITADADYPLDTTPPTLTLLAPPPLASATVRPSIIDNLDCTDGPCPPASWPLAGAHRHPARRRPRQLAVERGRGADPPRRLRRPRPPCRRSGLRCRGLQRRPLRVLDAETDADDLAGLRQKSFTSAAITATWPNIIGTIHLIGLANMPMRCHIGEVGIALVELLECLRDHARTGAIILGGRQGLIDGDGAGHRASPFGCCVARKYPPLAARLSSPGLAQTTDIGLISAAAAKVPALAVEPRRPYSVIIVTWGRHGFDVGRETRGACRGAVYLVNPSANL